MFNYIKWELKDFFKRSFTLLIVVAAVYLLFLILPFESKELDFIVGLVSILYIIAILGSFYGSFFMGTLRVVNSFSRKTFLLESMIPTSVEKILLAKYLLGLIINFVYIVVGITGIVLFLIKGIGVGDTFDVIKSLVENMDAVAVLKLTVSTILSSLTFMSVIVLVFVTIKSLLPNTNNKVIGVLIGFLSLYVVGYASRALDFANLGLYVVWAILLGITVVAYFLTTLLIKNKLEVYN